MCLRAVTSCAQRGKDMTFKARILVASLLGATLAGPLNAADIIYTYDTLGRLIQVVYPSGKTITYEYDDAGNRTKITVTP